MMTSIASHYDNIQKDSSCMHKNNRMSADRKRRARAKSEGAASMSIMRTLFIAGLAMCSDVQGQTHHLRRTQIASLSSTPSFVPSSSLNPSQLPSQVPSLGPSASIFPSEAIISSESLPPSLSPSTAPSEIPSLQPSLHPSLAPSQSESPSQKPSTSSVPSLSPSLNPSLNPTQQSLAPSEPISFRTTNCSYNPAVIGYELVESLMDDLVEYEVHQPFILCPNTTFDDMEIIVGGDRAVPLTLSCGGTDCRWVAASDHHLIVTDPVANLTFTGITFLGADKSSILLMNGGGDMHVQFEDCIWTENAGNETIIIEGRPIEVILPPEQNITTDDVDTNNSTNTGGSVVVINSTNRGDSITNTTDEGAASARYLKEETELSAFFVGCTFFKNVAQKAIVMSTRAHLRLESCSFEDNLVGALLAVKSGVVDLEDMAMARNNFTTGMIVVGENTSLTITESICTSSNKPSNADLCEGILVGEECSVVEQCETTSPSMLPSMVPSTAPSFEARACYDSLETLRAAIDDATSKSNDRATIQICADSVLDGNVEWMYSPIMIEKGDLRIQCGVTGKLSEGCLINGGDIQMHLGPGVQRVFFSGFAFVNAGQVSVVAAGSSNSEALFEHCHWRYNKAIAGVLVYNEGAGEKYTGQRNLEQLPPPSIPSMSVNFDTCFFEENAFSYAALATIRASAFLKSVVFQNQGTSRLGVIGATQGSSVGISSSCFIDNEALLEGIIVLDASSNITRNVQNFGEKNGALLGGCVTVFNDISGTCAIDGACQGDCLPFTATSCSPSTLNVDRPIGPTPAPVATPTIEPELPPSPVVNETLNDDAALDEEGESSGPGAGSIVVAIIAVFIILFAGFYCFRRGQKNKKDGGGGKKQAKKAPSFKGSKMSESLKKQKSKKKRRDDDDDDDDYEDEYDDDDDDGFYGEDDDESLEDKSSKKQAKGKTGGGWFGRGSGGKQKKVENQKKKGKRKGEKKKKPKKRPKKRKDDDHDESDDEDEESDNESEEDDDEESEEEDKPRARKWGKNKKAEKETKKKGKEEKKEEKEKSFWESGGSSSNLELSLTPAQKAQGAALIASVSDALS